MLNCGKSRRVVQGDLKKWAETRLEVTPTFTSRFFPEVLQFVSLTGAKCKRWITESSADPQRSGGRDSLTTLKSQKYTDRRDVHTAAYL